MLNQLLLDFYDSPVRELGCVLHEKVVNDKVKECFDFFISLLLFDRLVAVLDHVVFRKDPLNFGVVPQLKQECLDAPFAVRSKLSLGIFIEYPNPGLG